LICDYWHRVIEKYNALKGMLKIFDRYAFEFVSECLDSGDPITEEMIREIHRKLVEGVRGGKAQPTN